VELRRRLFTHDPQRSTFDIEKSPESPEEHVNPFLNVSKDIEIDSELNDLDFSFDNANMTFEDNQSPTPEPSLTYSKSVSRLDMSDVLPYRKPAVPRFRRAQTPTTENEICSKGETITRNFSNSNLWVLSDFED
jgi:hypothetical protein